MSDIDDLESGPIQPAETALNFEAEFAALRATKDGVRITLLVHPMEGCIPAFLQLGINKRLIVSAVAIGDDEDISPPPTILEGIRTVRRAGMLGRSEEFHRFAVAQGYMQQRDTPAGNEEAAKLFIRSWCRVKSRSDLKYDAAAQSRFQELIEELNQWSRENISPLKPMESELDL